MVRRIVKLHGGQVTATSPGSGAGSEFLVAVPVWAADMQHARGSENRVDPPVSVGAFRARRVMVVDDHEEMRKSVSRLVRAWGHEVALAADGPSALALADTFHPECAIVDISMPGMNGIELGRRLRQRFPPAQLRLIALSGYPGADIRDGCLAAGFDAYLVKPGDIRELERLLGGQRSEATAETLDASKH